MVPFSPWSGSEAWAVWTGPGGRFSGMMIWKLDCMNSGGLSLSSRTEHNTVAVPVIGREPLSRAWTANTTRQHFAFFYLPEEQKS